MNLPVPRHTITSICAARDASLATMQLAAETLEEGYALSKQARGQAHAASQGHMFHTHENPLFKTDFDAGKSVDSYRRSLDANVWTNLLKTTGMEDMMDKTAKDEFASSLRTDVPEVTEDNVTATLQNLFANADLIFQRGLAKAFSSLDKRFKSHDGFKIGSRMIIERLFDDNGYWRDGHTLQDIERVFAVLDGEKPSYNSLRHAVEQSRSGYGAKQSETEAAYFLVRGFKNGNAHHWFSRDDLVEKANALLAKYYGETLPDAATVNEKPTGTAVATKLQFYASPPAVVTKLLRDIRFFPGMKILEPSAGEGAILRQLPADADVTAVEFHPVRAAYIGAICANFLTWKGPQNFDLVLMNPPFHGIHWMDHVRKAFDHLKPGGRLRAVLPASAEVNESAKHQAFRAWAEKNKDTWRMWTELPPESFASSGTNVQTVILELKKK